jgi:2-polyprenyl-3-methyl-5-hydroxy-6-metoxy-1,4-benzoquinol methylase
MKVTDRILQRWRIARARRFLQPGDRILDIGSADGALFSTLGAAVGRGSLGVDPTLQQTVVVNGCELLPGFFPAAVPAAAGPFDAITLLAVLEHFPPAAYADLRAGCRRFLRPGGKLLITVPSPQVDGILKILTCLRLVDGMSLEEHHGYRVERTPGIFPEPFFRLLHHRKFQFGLNHLFVFEKITR